MKKWLISFFIFFLLLILSVYFFIPNYILINGHISISAPRDGLYRNLINEKNWEKWWPGSYKSQTSASSHKNFLFNHGSYTIDDVQLNSLNISVTKNNSTIKTSLQIFPEEQNTQKLVWKGFVTISINPLIRFQIKSRAREINDDINNILEKMQSYFSNDENLYGINIRKEYVVDSILIFTNATLKGLPETEFIYYLINDLKAYALKKSAQVTGFPMLSISTADSIDYLVKVALPVDKRLPSSGNISFKWMLGGGNILVTEVKGGHNSINSAFSQLQLYVDDNHLVSPAIPFQSLITNRFEEPDSNKWITRLYYPVTHY